MTTIQVIITLAVIAVVTLLTRGIAFVIFPGNKPIPPFISYLSKVLPFAVIGMLVIYCLRNVSFAAVSNWLPQLLCCGVVVLVHVLKRSTLLSIVCGTVCYMILVQHIF